MKEMGPLNLSNFGSVCGLQQCHCGSNKPHLVAAIRYPPLKVVIKKLLEFHIVSTFVKRQSGSIV